MCRLYLQFVTYYLYVDSMIYYDHGPSLKMWWNKGSQGSKERRLKPKSGWSVEQVGAYSFWRLEPQSSCSPQWTFACIFEVEGTIRLQLTTSGSLHILGVVDSCRLGFINWCKRIENLTEEELVVFSHLVFHLKFCVSLWCVLSFVVICSYHDTNMMMDWYN